MIVITVQTYNGQAMSGLAAHFDELGGTIGRAENNQLVLADPDRTVSRVHAQVVFRNGGYAIIDRGSNAILVNSQPLGNGREAPIRDGDLLTIGGYVLRVDIGQKTASPDPFADLFGDGARNKAATANPISAVPEQPTRIEPPAARPAAAPAAAKSAQVIPDDWDPFSTVPPRRSADALPPAAAGASGLGLGTSATDESLDNLFGLGGSGTDPLANSPLATPAMQANTTTDSDPLRAFGIAAAAAPAPASNHVSDLQTPWSAPPLREAAPAASAAPPPAAAAAPASPLSGAVLSWTQPSREGKFVTLPGGQPPAAPAPPAAPGSLTQIIPRANPSREGPPPPSAAPLPSSWPAATPPDALRAAFADGLGLPFDRVRPLDAAQMRLVGQLLREATQGAVELLIARAALKHEIRTQVTMIGAKENNPLKFSPSAEAALQQLLGEPASGFMAPAAAMRDAFDDLRAHQLGVVAGMRAALEGVLQRFNPAQLEARIAARRSTLSNLVPAMRKAQLWELFTELFAQLSAEAVDDFHELFGKAFREAYESHIDALLQTRS